MQLHRTSLDPKPDGIAQGAGHRSGVARSTLSEAEQNCFPNTLFSSPDTTFWAKRETWYFCSKAYHTDNLDKTMGYFVTRWWQDGTNRSSPFQHLNQSEPNPSFGFVARHVWQVPFRNRDGVCLWLRILCFGCSIVLTTVAFKIFFWGWLLTQPFQKIYSYQPMMLSNCLMSDSKKNTTQTPITSSGTFGQIIGGRGGRWIVASCTLATRSLGRIPVVEKGPPSITRRMSKPVFPGAGAETLGQVKKHSSTIHSFVCGQENLKFPPFYQKNMT